MFRPTTSGNDVLGQMFGGKGVSRQTAGSVEHGYKRDAAGGGDGGAAHGRKPRRQSA